MLFACCVLTVVGQPNASKIHAITDISHEFSFYFDGRFGGQYIAPSGGANAMNWGTLSKLDVSNVNLLVISSGATPCPYTEADIALVRSFLEAGGGVVVLGDYATFRDETTYRLNDLVKEFGAQFADDPSVQPLRAMPELGSESTTNYGGKVLNLSDPAQWTILMEDAQGRPVLARRPVGQGSLLVSSRALCGRQPDAKDPINAEWWVPLLSDLAKGKQIDPATPPQGASPENVIEKDGLVIQSSDYLLPIAETIFDIYEKCRPVQERIMGVPPHEGMLTTLILLPCSGGGFSSGVAIGLGVWWGDFPIKQYGMVELLGHEATHSWVLPFAEPLWNEGIATYVGILMGRELGLADDANATLRSWIDGAKQHDRDMTKIDIAHGKDVPHVVAMAKPMWIWEQLRAEKPDILALYFQAKRRLIDPAAWKEYTAHDSVAVLSLAMGRDLFPWFQSLGITVDRAKTTVPAP